METRLITLKSFISPLGRALSLNPRNPLRQNKSNAEFFRVCKNILNEKAFFIPLNKLWINKNNSEYTRHEYIAIERGDGGESNEK